MEVLNNKFTKTTKVPSSEASKRPTDLFKEKVSEFQFMSMLH